MPSVSAVLLEEVTQEPAQVGMATVGTGDVDELVIPPSAKAASSLARDRSPAPSQSA